MGKRKALDFCLGGVAHLHILDAPHAQDCPNWACAYFYICIHSYRLPYYFHLLKFFCRINRYVAVCKEMCTKCIHSIVVVSAVASFGIESVLEKGCSRIYRSWVSERLVIDQLCNQIQPRAGTSSRQDQRLTKNKAKDFSNL